MSFWRGICFCTPRPTANTTLIGISPGSDGPAYWSASFAKCVHVKKRVLNTNQNSAQDKHIYGVDYLPTGCFLSPPAGTWFTLLVTPFHSRKSLTFTRPGLDSHVLSDQRVPFARFVRVQPRARVVRSWVDVILLTRGAAPQL